jgi:transcriptional regulator with XRE-family HTH domain
MNAEVPGVNPVALGTRLRITREAIGLSQYEFGRRAGISKQAMNNIEKGRNFPTIPNVVALCEAHDLTLGWVCAGFFKGLRHELVEAIQAQLALQAVEAAPVVRRTVARRKARA